MYDEDITFDLIKSEEIKKKLFGKPYLWKDVYYCLFNNKETFPESLSILCRIKVAYEEGGIVYSTNPTKGTYKEVYVDNTIILNRIYKSSKYKILMRPNLNIGWEGRILNDARFS